MVMEGGREGGGRERGREGGGGLSPSRLSVTVDFTFI